MKKIKIIFIAALFITINLNAQNDEYEAGQWHFGPHLSAFFGAASGENSDEIGGINIGINAGAFGGYSFTDLIGVNVSALYSYEDWLEWKYNYLRVPALLLFQFNTKHLGLGIQYSHLLTSDFRDVTPFKSSNYLSGIIEYGYYPNLLFFSPTEGFFTERSIIRYIIRIGYAITPLTTTAEGAKGNLKPFFLETCIQYNIGRNFHDNKYSKKRSKAKKRRR